MGLKLFDGIAGLVGEGISFFRDKQKAKHDVTMAGMENRARLLRDEQSYNYEWEMATLEDKDKWLRRVSFSAFFLPFVVAIVSPEAVRDYFEVALASIPEWWQNVYIAITGAVWGLSSLKNTLGSTIGSLLATFNKKKTDK